MNSKRRDFFKIAGLSSLSLISNGGIANTSTLISERSTCTANTAKQ